MRRLAHKSILRSSELDAVAACQIRSSAVVEDCCILLPHLVIAKPVSSTLLAEGPCRKDTADGGIGGTGVSQNRRAGRGGQSGSLAVVSIGVRRRLMFSGFSHTGALVAGVRRCDPCALQHRQEVPSSLAAGGRRNATVAGGLRIPPGSGPKPCHEASSVQVLWSIQGLSGLES